MTVPGVMVVEYVLVNIKVRVLPAYIMDCEDFFIVAIIGNSELALDVLQLQNVGDGSFIEPYLIISLYIGFMGSIDGYTIHFYCHGIIYCSYSCNKPLVTK